MVKFNHGNVTAQSVRSQSTSNNATASSNRVAPDRENRVTGIIDTPQICYNVTINIHGVDVNAEAKRECIEMFQIPLQ
ncbi:hypothetical protein Y71_05585 [Kosakonia radicincitans DSM 16656]|nr:hypothetical protein Y71_05585 [Kosakonia radicincitans DSM 16656]